MIFDNKRIAYIECETCANNINLVCPCSIFSGNVNLPNLFNIKFPEKKNKNSYIKNNQKIENIYEAKL